MMGTMAGMISASLMPAIQVLQAQAQASEGFGKKPSLYQTMGASEQGPGCALRCGGR